MEYVDLNTWDRKNLYNFYSTFDKPCFSITFKVEAKKLWEKSRKENLSFFLLCLWVIMSALNDVKNFKYRIMNGQVVLFEKCNAVTPIAVNDELFQEIAIFYDTDFEAFYQKSSRQIEQVKLTGKANAGNNNEEPFIISCLPWLHFESLVSADYDFKQTNPCITFGKYEKGMLPIAVKANHCFVDGIHVKRFADAFYDRMNEICSK